MHRFRGAIAMAALALGACGGGGGGGSAGFTLSTQRVAFSGLVEHATPPSQSVAMDITDQRAAYVGAGFRNGDPGWLAVEFAASEPGFDVILTVLDTNGPPGTRNTVLSVGIADENGDILSTRDIDVSYTLGTRLGFASAPLAPVLVYGGAAITTGQVDVLGASATTFTVTTTAPWLSVPGGALSGDFTVGFDASGLEVGVHTGTITVTNVNTPTDTATQDVSLTVRVPQMTIQTLPYSTAMVHGSSDHTRTTSVQVAGDPGTFTANSDASWLTAPAGALAIPGSFDVTVDEAGLAPGQHSATLTLTNGQLSSVQATLDVTLNVQAPTVTFTSPSFTLGGANGLTTTDSKDLGFSINTGTNAHSWTITLDSTGDWLTTSSSSGTVGAAGAAVTVGAERQHVSHGAHAGTVTVEVVIDGYAYSATSNVTLNLAGNRLRASATGVALSHFPSRSVLTRDLTIDSSLGFDQPWEAASSESWLSVTPDGRTGDTLSMVADPTGLAANALHSATITVTSSEPAVENTQVIRVGLWVGDTDPATVEVPPGVWRPEVSPAAPYVAVQYYPNDGVIKLYNVYTGALVRNLPAAGAFGGPAAFSPDGATFYIPDTVSDQVQAIDVETGAVVGSFSFWESQHYSGVSILPIRPRGHDLLLVYHPDAYWVYDANTGAQLAYHDDYMGAWRLGTAAGPDHLSLYDDCRCSSGTVYRNGIDYSELQGGTFVNTPEIAQVSIPGFARQIVTSDDGERVYVALGGSVNVLTANLDSTLHTLQPGQPHPVISVVPLRDGRAIGGFEREYNFTSDEDIYIYDPAGTLVDSLVSYDGLGRLGGLQVSNDETRMVTSIGGPSIEPRLRFRDVPPP